jgi:PTHB1 C-terminus
MTEIIDALQGWEEMVDASVTHLLRTSLSKNAKDVTLNPTPLSSLKDVQSVKKHIAMMCDRLSKGAKLSDGKHSVNSMYRCVSDEFKFKRNRMLLLILFQRH